MGSDAIYRATPGAIDGAWAGTELARHNCRNSDIAAHHIGFRPVRQTVIHVAGRYPLALVRLWEGSQSGWRPPVSNTGQPAPVSPGPDTNGQSRSAPQEHR